MRESKVRMHLDGKEVRKRIYVPDKLLNLVVA
jgi:leucyl-tRNA synthetase